MSLSDEHGIFSILAAALLWYGASVAWLMLRDSFNNQHLLFSSARMRLFSCSGREKNFLFSSNTCSTRASSMP